jgi:cell division protein FtsI (penicillin-binding protein 3)
MVKLKNRSETIKNIRVIGLLFIVFFFIIGFRGYSLQVLSAEKLSKIIKRQTERNIELSPKRGTIYDRNGSELSVSIDVESLFARPHLIENKSLTAIKISRILGISHKTILKEFDKNKGFVWIKRQIPPAEASKIKKLGINGLDFTDESQRFYPNKELGAQMIGFVGRDSKGLEGIEFEYNNVLKGKSRYLAINRDALGRQLFIDGANTSEEVQGNDIILTIDKNIQYIAEKELQAAISISKAKSGIAIVMEPATGKVLAMAVAPLFNPNQYKKYEPKTWRNRAITDEFEPGSTFKTFLMASALEENIIKPKDIFFCENGSFRVANRVIHDTHPHGWLNATKILKYSSNIGVSKIARHLGSELFYQHIREFGFGEETGVAFPSEANGSIPLPYRTSEHTRSAMAFGQGISVSPLQLATAYSAIANGGLYMKPYFVEKVTHPNGMIIQETKPQVLRRVVSEKTARTVRNMLKSVVSKDGTGEKARTAAYNVAGKTGTSQKIDKKLKTYSSQKLIASFAGFAPADDPAITVLVIIDEPEKMMSGGAIAAPTFSRITNQTLNYLHITPDKQPQYNYENWQEANNTAQRNNVRG